LDQSWAGIAFISPNATNEPVCSANWTFSLVYVYHGSVNDTAFKTQWNTAIHFAGLQPDYNLSISYPTWWDWVKQDLEPIVPPPNLFAPIVNESTGGVPSVLVSRQKVSNGQLAQVIISQSTECLNRTANCTSISLYQDITGNIHSPQITGTSLTPGMRSSIFHLIVSGSGDEEKMNQVFYPLGSNSYFGESAYNMTNWKTRLFGENYDRLLSIKRSRDPRNRFWCRHCIGDD